MLIEQAEPGAVERLTEWLDLRDKPQAALMSDDYIHALVWDKAPGDTIMDDDLRALLADLARMKAALVPFRQKWDALRDPLPQQPFTITVNAMLCCDAALALRQHEDGR